MTRGLWRIDALRLAVLGPDVEPTRHRPVRVRRVHADETALDPPSLAALLDSTRTLVTLPGDERVASLAYALMFVGVWALITWVLDRRRIYLKV